jgi:hypothetical protein
MYQNYQISNQNSKFINKFISQITRSKIFITIRTERTRKIIKSMRFVSRNYVTHIHSFHSYENKFEWMTVIRFFEWCCSSPRISFSISEVFVQESMQKQMSFLTICISSLSIWFKKRY